MPLLFTYSVFIIWFIQGKGVWHMSYPFTFSVCMIWFIGKKKGVACAAPLLFLVFQHWVIVKKERGVGGMRHMQHPFTF